MNERDGVRATTRHELTMQIGAHDAAVIEQAIADTIAVPDNHPLFYERYVAQQRETMRNVLRGVPVDWVLRELRGRVPDA